VALIRLIPSAASITTPLPPFNPGFDWLLDLIAPSFLSYFFKPSTVLLK
jgi:hypothetical protein